MTGSFTSEGEPTLPVHVAGPAEALDVDAIVDTGFNGELTLPQEQIEALGLPEASVTTVTLADGRVREVQMYLAEARLDGQVRQVFVAEAPTTPLLGTDLLWGFLLCIAFQADGRIDIEPLPDRSA